MAGSAKVPADTMDESSTNETLQDANFEKETVAAVDNESTAEPVYPGGLKIVLIAISLMLSIFCVALDNTVSRNQPILELLQTC